MVENSHFLPRKFTGRIHHVCVCFCLSFSTLTAEPFDMVCCHVAFQNNVVWPKGLHNARCGRYVNSWAFLFVYDTVNSPGDVLSAGSGSHLRDGNGRNTDLCPNEPFIDCILSISTLFSNLFRSQVKNISIKGL